MAKTGFPVGEERFPHRDPVSGETKIFYRDKHSRQSSPRVIAHKKCVRERMEGFHASGSTPKERSQSVRNALSASSKACASAR